MTQQSGPPKWIMWGGQQSINVAGLGGILQPPVQQSPQIANVTYDLPTTWHFLLYCSVSYVGAVAPVNAFRVEFILQPGVGRSNSQLDPFVTFDFTAADFLDPTKTTRWVTTAQAQDPSAFKFATTVPNVVDSFPAQSIQLGARAFSQGGLALGTTINAQVAGYFSPVTHMRPEWFEARTPPTPPQPFTDPEEQQQPRPPRVLHVVAPAARKIRRR